MNRFTLIVIFNLLVVAVNAQKETYDTIPYAQEYHQKRLAIFNSEPIVKDRIMFLGNSITEFGDWKNLLNDSTVINRGIAGDITFGVLDRLDDVIARQPLKLFIKIGVNDISKNIPEEVIVRNIFTIVQRIKSESPKSEIFVHSILPSNDNVKATYPDAFGKNDVVVTVNNQLSNAAKNIGFTFIDLHKKFKDKNGKLDAQYADDDGLHLNSVGYQLWVKILKRKYL